MVETHHQEAEEEKISTVLRSIKEGNLSNGEAFELCQRKFPEVTEHARLFVVKLPEIFPGYWTKTWADLDGWELLDMAMAKDDASRRISTVRELQNVYLNSEGRKKRSLFNVVFAVTREYLRPKKQTGQNNMGDAT